MPQLELDGNLYEVDENGFLQEPERWDKNVARAFAAREGITELTEEHWRVIDYLRDYYLANKICPRVRKLTQETGLNLRRMYDLFPQGPANSACKWAGIPKSTGCM